MLSLLSSSILKRTSLNGIYIMYSRGLRGEIKPIRSKLPKYQKNLSDLPPLNQLLTEKFEIKSLEEAKELRTEKLRVYKSYMPDNHNFLLLEAIFHPNNDVDGLLQVIDQNLETMNSFYIAVCFEALDDMMRAKLCEIETVIVSPEFKRLCTKALYKMRFLESDELLKIIKCLSTVRMPETSLITQATLQMSRHLINDFDEQELMALGQVLEEMKVEEEPKKSLIETMKKAQQLLLKSKVHQLEGGST